MRFLVNACCVPGPDITSFEGQDSKAEGPDWGEKSPPPSSSNHPHLDLADLQPLPPPIFPCRTSRHQKHEAVRLRARLLAEPHPAPQGWLSAMAAFLYNPVTIGNKASWKSPVLLEKRPQTTPSAILARKARSSRSPRKMSKGTGCSDSRSLYRTHSCTVHTPAGPDERAGGLPYNTW